MIAMVLKSDASFSVGPITREFMKFRTGNIRTPLVVEEVAVYCYNPIKDLFEMAIFNDDFKLIPLAGKLGSAVRSGIDII